MKIRLFLIAALLSCSFFCSGADIDVCLEGRGSIVGAKSANGFRGEYANLLIGGELDEHFTFFFRQRLNKSVQQPDFFSATDHMWIRYRNNGWEFMAGKMVIEYGGFEYDASPIDVYFAGEYWDNFAGAFNFAVTASRYIGSERLSLQVARSPYSIETLSGLYAYSMSLNGQVGKFEHLYSVNFFQVEKGRFMAHQAFGNAFHLDPFDIEFDLIHKFDMRNPTFFKDFSVVAKASFSASPCVDIFAKGTYDFNSVVADPQVLPGTELLKLGGGVELFPWKDHRNFRIHCLYYHGIESVVMVGLTCKLDILK